nr:MAG TPA: hypothetical protein [Caudoviricetes sp.]
MREVVRYLFGASLLPPCCLRGSMTCNDLQR